jgi:prophage maintenance system killer protein
MIRHLTLAEVQLVSYQLAKELLEFNEPIPSFESRFPDKLESCIATPFQTFGGKPLYRGLLGKASILFYLMIKNHPFENGNKRIAVATLFLFLARNGKWISVEPFTLYQFAKSVAESKPNSRKKVIIKIRSFFKSNLVTLDR